MSTNVYISATELRDRLLKTIKKGESISRYTDSLKENLFELRACLNIVNNPKLLSGNRLNEFVSLAEEVISELNNNVKKYFIDKHVDNEKVSKVNNLANLMVSSGIILEKDVENQIKTMLSWNSDAIDNLEKAINKAVDKIKPTDNSVDDNERFENEDELEGLESLLPDDQIWDKETIDNARKAVAEANAKREEERRNNSRGKKVKRVPLKDKFDASDVARALGMSELAKELTVDYPKPIVPIEKDGSVTKRQYYRDTEDKGESFESVQELLNKNCDEDYSPYKHYSKEAVSGFYGTPKPGLKKDVTVDTSNFSAIEDDSNKNIGVVRHLEMLIGRYTTEKLAAERKLVLAEIALKEANETLCKSNVKQILGIDEFKTTEPSINNLKEELDDAFKGRKF
jgi:hypothetical protein